MGSIGRRSRAARRAAAGTPPPTSSIGCGRVAGFGVTRTVRPRHSNGSPRPRVEQHADVLLEDPAPRRVLHPRHLELFDAVARADHDPEAAGRSVVEHRDLLGDAHRVVQREDRGAHHDPRVGGAAEHDAGDRERRRLPAVVDAVVLGEHEQVEAVAVGPLVLVERGRVDVACRRGTERREHESRAACRCRA